MALTSFNNFLKANKNNDKIKLAASLIESRRFPIKLFAKWYENYGVFLPSKQYSRVLKEAWSDYGQAALQGAGAGAALGSAFGGIGAGVGAGVGALGGAAVQGGKDLYNWAMRNNAGHVIKKFEATAKQAESILQQLKELANNLVRLNVTNSENFSTTIDGLIEQLRAMNPGGGATPAANTPTNTNATNPPAGAAGGGMAREIPEQDVEKVEEQLKTNRQYQQFIKYGIVNFILDNSEEISKMPGGVNLTEEDIRSAIAHWMVENGDSSIDRSVEEFLDQYIRQGEGSHKPFDAEVFKEFLGRRGVEASEDEISLFNSIIIASRIKSMSEGHEMTQKAAIERLSNALKPTTPTTTPTPTPTPTTGRNPMVPH